MTRIEFIDWLEGKGFERVELNMNFQYEHAEFFQLVIWIYDTDFGMSLNDGDNIIVDHSLLQFPSSHEHAAEFFRILGIEF